MHDACYNGNNPKYFGGKLRVWRADLSGAAFGKITAVYGHIDENGAFVRKWLWLNLQTNHWEMPVCP